MSARRRRRAPLPVRHGLNPTRLSLPRDAEWGLLVEYLAARFPDDATRLRAAVAAGEVVDELGRAYTPSSPYPGGGMAYFYRVPPVEKRVPFEVEILHRDDNLIVVDKPHFLAVTPRGAWIAETVVVRLRRELGMAELSPAHRLDRLTAGVLVLTTRRDVRGAYQEMFAQRTVTKVYEAVAPLRDDLAFPRMVRSRIVKQHGVLQAQQVAGEINAITDMELLAPANVAGHGLYRLTPHTGRTHQLRVHAASEGIPLVGDDLYPEVRAIERDDYRNPLQLLARSISFDDPLTGERREFSSRRMLDLA